MVLKEWRHWLEGAELPFLAWTDHKNLKYLHTAKRLNSRQARWALFSNHFNFQLSYRLESKNSKPGALSHIHSPKPEELTFILLQTCIIGAISWEVQDPVKQALVNTVPAFCPQNQPFVVSSYSLGPFALSLSSQSLQNGCSHPEEVLVAYHSSGYG